MTYNSKGLPNLEPQSISYGDGDHTVNVYSASACLRWKGDLSLSIFKKKSITRIFYLLAATL